MDGVIGILISILCGIISGLAILPIASDGIRDMIFGRRKRALQGAKKELLETIEGMLLSGQSISEDTFVALANSVANKYGINEAYLGRKDENIAIVLQIINSSKIVPNDIKRLLSNHIQAQIGNNSNKIEHHKKYDELFETYDFNKFEFDESLKRKTEYGQDIENTYFNRVHGYSIPLTVLVVGTLTGVGVYVSNIYNIFPIIICLSAILICINILTLLMDAAESPTAATIKRLVYKVAFIIVLISLLLIYAFIKVK